jgi:argininosuccinate lyase
MEKKSWRGTRFKKKLNPKADDFLKSIAFDYKLLEYDIQGSIAHAKMLGKCGIIKKEASDTLVSGLKAVLKDYKKNKQKFITDADAEDVHVLVTDKLKGEIKSVAKKLHTGRSRNDQVALDVRLYCKDKINALTAGIGKLQEALLVFSKKHIDVAIPAYTHQRLAQWVLLPHCMLAYLEMFQRDKARLTNAYELLDELPLGSCALSGVSLPIDREYVAKLLGFSRVSKNSIDAVSDRDFVIEILSALAIFGMHTSRLSEDLILWSMRELSYLEIDESFCTGSSIMPHKKNPDVLEYMRGYAGKLYGNLVSLLVTMKGLPLSYNRDMQHDKEALFNSVEIVEAMLPLLAELLKNVKKSGGYERKKDRLKVDYSLDQGLYSVDFVEYLVTKGQSYEDAHDATGKLMRYCYDTGAKLEDLSVEQLRKYSRYFDEDIYAFTRAVDKTKKSINLKTSYGGTALKNVRKQIKHWERVLQNA